MWERGSERVERDRDGEKDVDERKRAEDEGTTTNQTEAAEGAILSIASGRNLAVTFCLGGSGGKLQQAFN